MSVDTQIKTQPDEKLVDAHGLLARLFEPETRPSLRWIRSQTRRKAIPCFKLGRLIRYDPALVRQALERNCLVLDKASARTSRATPGGAR